MMKSVPKGKRVSQLVKWERDSFCTFDLWSLYAIATIDVEAIQVQLSTLLRGLCIRDLCGLSLFTESMMSG